MKPSQFFLDSNFLVALLDSRDSQHLRAVRLLEIVSGDNCEIFASDVLINEVLSVMAKRCEERRALDQFEDLVTKFKSAIQPLPILCLYDLIPKNYGTIMKMMIRHKAKLNFHDCLIVLFLKGVPEVNLVTFDGDFKEIDNLRIVS